MKLTRILGLCGFFLLVSGAALEAKTAEEWYREAFQHSLNGASQNAIRSYREALRLKPGWAKAHHGLAVAYYRIGDGVKAIHHLRRAEKLYRKATGPAAQKNLLAVRQNLQKTYKKFDLDPKEFEEMESLHPIPAKEQWKPSGNGFLFGDRGYLLTLNHMVKGAKAVRVRFADRSTAEATLVKHFIIYNVSLLKLPNPNRDSKRILNLADLSSLAVGDPIFAVDYSDLAASPADAVSGAVTELRAIQQDTNFLQMDLPVKPELSGGPLLNARGQVVGIILSVAHTMESFQSDGRTPEGNIALTSSYLRRVLPRVIGPLPVAEIGRDDSGSQIPAAVLETVILNLVAIEISR